MGYEEIVLDGTKRDIFGRQVKALRRQGKLPAILYGKDMESLPITMDSRSTQRALGRITSSSLVRVMVDGEPYHTLLRERQYNYLTGNVIHLDFLVVSLTETVRTEVSIQFEGEAPAVKEYNGLLASNIDTIEVECLPTDLPDRILVNLSVLKEIGDSILVKDLTIPDMVTLLTDPEETVVVISAPSMAEEEAAEEGVEEEPEAEPELIEKRKKEELEKEEGGD